jgi:hypothetical protein
MDPSKNPDQLKGNISLSEFAQAIQALDLKSIPPEKRSMAIRTRWLQVVLASISDQDREYLKSQLKLRAGRPSSILDASGTPFIRT